MKMCPAQINAGSVQAAINLCKSEQVQNSEGIIEGLDKLFKSAVGTKNAAMNEVGALLSLTSLNTRACAKMAAVIIKALGQSKQFAQELMGKISAQG